MSVNKMVKNCFVEYCGNNSKKQPNKIFVSVPNDGNLKKAWFETARRKMPVKFSTTSYFCCEDHFDLQNDMENYMYHRLIKMLELK